VLLRTERQCFALSVDDAPVALQRPLSPEPKVTNQEKVLFPRDGLTKADLVAYYRDVAPVFLEHMRARPIVAQRWPDGIDEFTWYQHRVPPRAPDYLRVALIDGNRRLLIENVEALCWMVNQAALTFHGWATRVGSLEHPDFVVIDLDPGSSTTWPQVIEVALALRALLELLEAPSVVKTSGQKGLHLLVPLAPGQTLQAAHAFAAGVCAMVAQLKPDVVSLVAEKGPRRGRLFLDALQNFKGKSLVLPYAVRALDGAPVSMPVRWEEVTEALSPRAFTIADVRQRLEQFGDLASPVLRGKFVLGPALDRLRGR
jgi:bifunctional non-homologous end joining protein LigD